MNKDDYDKIAEKVSRVVGCDPGKARTWDALAVAVGYVSGNVSGLGKIIKHRCPEIYCRMKGIPLLAPLRRDSAKQAKLPLNPVPAPIQGPMPQPTAEMVNVAHLIKAFERVVEENVKLKAELEECKDHNVFLIEQNKELRDSRRSVATLSPRALEFLKKIQ